MTSCYDPVHADNKYDPSNIVEGHFRPSVDGTGSLENFGSPILNCGIA